LLESFPVVLLELVPLRALFAESSLQSCVWLDDVEFVDDGLASPGVGVVLLYGDEGLALSPCCAGRSHGLFVLSPPDGEVSGPTASDGSEAAPPTRANATRAPIVVGRSRFISCSH
jgi:hypothetical protein